MPDFPPLADLILLGLWQLVPSLVLILLFYAWHSPAGHITQWLTAKVGDTIPELEVLGVKLKEVSVRGVVYLIPPLSLFFPLTWLLATSASTPAGLHPRNRYHTIAGEFLYENGGPSVGDSLVVARPPQRISALPPLPPHNTYRFVIDHIDIDDEDVEGGLIRLQNGCMQSDFVPVSTKAAQVFGAQPSISLDTLHGVRRLVDPLVLTYRCQRVTIASAPGGQDPVPMLPIQQQQ